MELRVLGPLEVVGENGLVPVAAPKQRRLLAALAIHRGAAATADALIDAVWAEDPPASAAKLLQVYVSQLRRLLPDDARIVTTAGGYALELEPDALDVARFERLLSDGRAALGNDNAALASSLLSRALGLWRGDAYAEVRYEDFAQREIERLEALRLAALQERIDADLRLGRHADVLGELRGLLAAHPTSEQLTALAMLAAYRAAGPAEALSVYETARRALDLELGVEPGAEVQRLRERIETRDPALAAPTAVPEPPTLPVAPTPLVGRERDLAELRELLARPGVRLVTLSGAGGSGKTRLAVEVARHVASSYANGVVLVELAPLRDPELVLPTIARAVGVEAAAPDEKVLDSLVAAIRDLELLLVLDNAEHVRPAAAEWVELLSRVTRLTLLVTSQSVLHVSGERVFPVGPLGDDAAVQLFVERARSHDPAFELTPANLPDIRDICRRVDNLPLAIELAAARVRTLGIRDLRARLVNRLSLLTGGPRDLPARQQTLREAVRWTANLLTTRDQHVLARLTVFPGGCTLEGAERVAGADMDAMSALVDHHLVQPLDVQGERRFRLLETIREYAYEVLGDERAGAEAELTRYYLELVERAELNAAGEVQLRWLARLDAELDNLRDALAHASRDPDPDVELRLAGGLWRYWWIRGFLAEGGAILDGILARGRVAPTNAGARVVRAAASFAWSRGATERAEALAAEALEVARAARAEAEEVSAHNLLGVIANSQPDLPRARYHLEESVRLAERAGLAELADTARLNLGIAYMNGGLLADATRLLEEVLDHRIHEGLSEGVGFVQLNLGQVALDAGDLDLAARRFEEARAAFTAVGFRARVGHALGGLAAVEARAGRPEAAARLLGRASVHLDGVGWSADGGELAAQAETAARATLGEDTYAACFGEGAAIG